VAYLVIGSTLLGKNRFNSKPPGELKFRHNKNRELNIK
jgi:hypothetical protein